MRNVLVTGGAGFIGSHLVERLLGEGGWRVEGVDDFNGFYDPALKRRNGAPHLSRPDFRLVEADIRDRAALAGVFRDAPFDCVVHLAARASAPTSPYTSSRASSPRAVPSPSSATARRGATTPTSTTSSPASARRWATRPR